MDRISCVSDAMMQTDKISMFCAKTVCDAPQAPKHFTSIGNQSAVQQEGQKIQNAHVLRRNDSFTCQLTLKSSLSSFSMCMACQSYRT
eukprot:763180-Hanusia_phi.AAC.2